MIESVCDDYETEETPQPVEIINEEQETKKRVVSDLKNARIVWDD